MKIVQNFGAGLLVSMVGSLPLGYINLIAAKLFELKGLHSLGLFLLGVITVEMVVVTATLNGAEWLLGKKKLVKTIEILSITFLLFLSFTFYFGSGNNPAEISEGFITTHHPYVFGLLLNGINLIQIPFWAGWNLFLINEKYIDTISGSKVVYVTGTALGTLIGIYAFVRFLNYIVQNGNGWSPAIMKLLFPLMFIALAVLQAIKFVRKYRNV